MPSLVGALLAVAVAGDAEAFRCNGQLVDTGERRFEVERTCGAPDFVEHGHGGSHLHHGVDDEIWFYNFGPHRLLRVLHFRNARLRRIDTAGYGFREDDIDQRPCRPDELRANRTSYELLQRCGEPVERTRRVVTIAHDGRHGGHHGHGRHVVEDWYYLGGERHFDRRVRLREGRVIEVSSRLDGP